MSSRKSEVIPDKCRPHRSGKAVSYQADVRLCDRLRKCLVKSARKNGVELRKTYGRFGKRYCAANAFIYGPIRSDGEKATKQLKTSLRRVHRDMKQKMIAPDMKLQKNT